MTNCEANPPAPSTGNDGAGADVATPPPGFPDGATAERVGDLLARAGYSMSGLRGALPGHPASLALSCDLIRSELLPRLPEVTAALLRTLFVGEPMSRPDAEGLLGAAAVADLLASGLVRDSGDALRPTAQLCILEDRVVAADLPARHEARASDVVVGPFGVTHSLAAFAFREPVDALLDLGCGAGALGVLARHFARRVVATDVNGRALAFARFNGALNGVAPLDTRQGSLFEPVAGERFDRILCNPPYAITPDATFQYRDGGTALCRAIVQQAPLHLTDEGFLQMMVEWPEREDQDWHREVREWVDTAAVPCDLWVLRFYSHPAHRYAYFWLRQEYPDGPPEPALERWRDHLAALGIHSVGGGVLVLRRMAARTPVRAIRDAPALSGHPAATSLAGWIRATGLLQRTPDPADLLDVTLVPAPSLEGRSRTRPGGDGWITDSRELRIARGLRFGAAVDPVAREIVGLMDGRRTAREALERFAERRHLRPEPFLSGFPRALARLLELGLLVPSG